jgi:hypothetical protein
MCFSLGWLEQFLVWVVIVCAIVAIIQLLLPYVLTFAGAAGAIIVAVLRIVLWAAVAIFLIYLCFDLISCLGGLHLPRMGG